MVQFVFALPVLLHAFAHISGFMANWTSNDAGWSDRPWIFSANGTRHSPVGRVFGILWLVAGLAVLITGLGLLFSQSWWPTLAVPAAILSLAVILPWWNTVPFGAKLGAAFDVLALVLLLVPSLRAWLLNLLL